MADKWETGPTPSVEEFLAEEAADDNMWWRISCGHHQNLFEKAVDQRDEARALVAAAEARGRKQAADEIAQRIGERILDSSQRRPAHYISATRRAADIARAYAAEQDTGP